MSDNHSPLNRSMLARTQERMHRLLYKQPVLLNPRAEHILNDEINSARRSGDVTTAADLIGIRDALRDIRRRHTFPLPDVPGAHVASDLIRALLGPASHLAVPVGSLDNAFFAVRSALKIHVKKYRLSSSLSELQRLDRRIAAAGGAAKRTARAGPSLLALLEQWLEVRTWEDSFSFVKAHEALAAKECADVLALLLQGVRPRDDEDRRRLLEQHLSILDAARTGGLEEVYRALIDEARQDRRYDYLDDQLMAWLGVLRALDPSSAQAAEVRARNGRQLSLLSGFFDAPRADKGTVHIPVLSGPLAPADVRRAQDLYRRVVAQGGKGSQKAQQALLESIAVSADLTSLSFWQECLSFQKKGDQMVRSRLPTAVVALAMLGIEHDEASPVQALLALLLDDPPFVRALAVDYLGQVFLVRNTSLPSEIRQVMELVARADTMLRARYYARAILKINGLPVPHDHAGEVFTLKVWYSGALDVRRMIEIRSEQTLEDLHQAIQTAMGWQAGEPYSFDLSISGNKRDNIYSPGTKEGVFLATEWSIGDLGLDLRGFLFYHTGEKHYFGIAVQDIRKSADRGVYPRVVERQGEPPEQFGSSN